MKKSLFCIIAIFTVMLCGCGHQASGWEDNARVMTMGRVEISSGSEIGDEYTTAKVSVDGVDSDIEIKLRGNSSKESEKKAYNIKFGDEVEFLGMEPGKKWSLISDPFDKSLLRPSVGFAYAEALGLENVSETRLCQVWVDGVYMGVYTAVEPVEAGEVLLERNAGRYEEDVTYMISSAGLRFEFNEPEDPDNKQQKEIYDMLAQAEEAIFSGDHEVYSQYIDVESFVNFYIFHEVIKDIDFGEYSTRYYFRDGKLCAGPPWDLDLTMGNVSAEKNEGKYDDYNYPYDAETDGQDDWAGSYSYQGMWAEDSDYYYWLCKDPWFMEKVAKRWKDVRAVTENLAVDNKLGRSLIDSYLSIHLETLEGNFMHGGTGNGTEPADLCWTVDKVSHPSEWSAPADTYEGNVELLREWLIKRTEYLDKVFGIGYHKDN